MDELLNATGYKVEAAFALWQQRRNQAAFDEMRGHGHDTSKDTAESEAASQNRPQRTPEQERRELVAILFDMIDAISGEDFPPLQRSEAIMLLQEGNWDLDRARDLWLEHQLAFEQFTESYNELRLPTTVALERDQRLAMLINATGRSDVYSLRMHLRSHNYNYIAAVVAWQKSGIPVLAHPDDVQAVEKGTERPDVRPNTDGTQREYPDDSDYVIDDDVSWPSEESDVQKDLDKSGGKDSEEEMDDAEDYGTSEARPGVLISTDREAAEVGLYDATKYIVEGFQPNGQYKSWMFRHKAYCWENNNTPRKRTKGKKSTPLKDLPAFDWNNISDVKTLNKWRRQRFQRITKSARPPTVKWLPVEDNFLHQFHQEHLELLMKAKPGQPEDNFLPFRVRPELQRRWAQRFNDRFAGTIQPGSVVTRPERSMGAINLHRQRIPSIINRFKVEWKDPQGSKKDKKPQSPPESPGPSPSTKTRRPTKRKREEEGDDSDSFGEDPGSDDDGDNDDGPKKKVKTSGASSTDKGSAGGKGGQGGHAGKRGGGGK